MAIEQLSRIQFVIQKSQLKAFRNQLFQKGLFHLSDISQRLEPLKYSPQEEQIFRSRLNKVRYLLDTSQRYSLQKSAFIDNFIPKRPIIDQDIVDSLQSDQILDELFDAIKRHDENLMSCQDRLDSIESEIRHLKPFEDFDFRFQELAFTKMLSIWLIESPQNRDIDDMKRLFPQLFEYAMLEQAISNEKISSFILVAPASSFEHISAYIKRTDLQILNIHNYRGTPLEMIRELENKKDKLIQCIESSKKALAELQNETPRLYCISDIIESQLLKLNGEKKFTASKQVVVVEGYARSADLDDINMWLRDSFPNVFMLLHPADNHAPIKFNNKAFFAPFEFLLRMFGLPRYGMIDPTPVVALLFLILFGIAFGDVIYGLVLVLICIAISKKYAHDLGTVRFMNMFKYAGVSSAFFGALTTSWAGDLVSNYLSPNHLLHKIHLTLGLINTGQHVMILMVAIIYLGVIAQMIAIFMAMLQSLKEGKWLQAILDQFSWILFMPSATILVGQFLVPGYFPENLVLWSTRTIYLSMGMIFIGGFIKVKNPIGGLFNGVLNFYGILSTYGVSALMADVLSYLRLLALAVATSSMAMSFNLVSFMFKDIPGIGIIIVIIVLIFSNMLNLLLSVLGAFVHPVRLLFYELFSRFYQDGGYEFDTYGLRFRNVFVKQREA